MRFLKRRGKRLLAGSATAMLGVLAFTSLAAAAPHHPTGEFAQFGDCPLNRATITDCIYSVTSSGSFTIGKKTVPIKNPVTLQGGFEGEGESIKFFGAEDGNTLSKTPQPVPGGLLGITAPTWWPTWLQEAFNETINKGLTGVNATVELAAPATSIKLNTGNLLFESGVALQLPIKVHLENSFLGSSCYIGSEKSPIVIPFTTGATSPPGPNKSIHGAAGSLSINPDFTLLTFSGGRLVENAFSAPGASGCGGPFIELFVDPLVNEILGTPSAAGKNTAILEGKIQDANAAAVRASE
jgi:hypothetical protein